MTINRSYARLGFSLTIFIVVGGIIFWQLKHHKNPPVTTPTTNQQKTSTKTEPTQQKQTKVEVPTFNKQQYSLTTPTSIWVIVNKKNPLKPVSYTPTLTVPNIPLRLSSGSEEMHVSTAMAPALESLVSAAKKDSINLMIASGYRSYTFQTGLYNGYVKTQGQAQADLQSARPGHSEHQTGLALDFDATNRVCEIQACFANTPEGKWLAANAYKYGFILRYPDGKTSITGYEFEPWHYRYVGTDLSNEMYKQNIATLEEFFGYPPAPTY